MNDKRTPPVDASLVQRAEQMISEYPTCRTGILIRQLLDERERLQAAIRVYEKDLKEKLHILNKGPYHHDESSWVASCLDLLHTMMRENGVSHEP